MGLGLWGYRGVRVEALHFLGAQSAVGVDAHPVHNLLGI